MNEKILQKIYDKIELLYPQYLAEKKLTQRQDIVMRKKILEAAERYINKRGVHSSDLSRLCLDNLHIVAEIAFDESIPTATRHLLLLNMAIDDKGSCDVHLSPRWARMMRTCIIPHFDKLPKNDPDDIIRVVIRWYQDVHGL